MDLLPQQSTVIENGQTKTIPTKQVQPQMLLQLQTGDKIPVDGKLNSGELWVNEAILTGESQPIKKKSVISLPPEPWSVTAVGRCWQRKPVATPHWHK